MNRKCYLLLSVMLLTALPASSEITTWVREKCEDEVTQTLLHQWVGGARRDWLNGFDNLRTDSLVLTGDSIIAYVKKNTSWLDTPKFREAFPIADPSRGVSGVDSITFFRNHGYEILNYPAGNQVVRVGDTIWCQWACDFRDLYITQRATWVYIQFGQQETGMPFTIDCFTGTRIAPNTGAKPGDVCNNSFGDGSFRNGIVGHWPWVVADSIYSAYPPNEYSRKRASVSDSVLIYVRAELDPQYYHPIQAPDSVCVQQDVVTSRMPHYFTIAPRQ